MVVTYTEFLNKEVINTNNERGEVIAFDKDYIVVKYSDSTKTYNSELPFKNKFLSFLDNRLNKLIEEDLENKEIKQKEKDDEIKKSHQKVIIRRQKINELNQKIELKYRQLKKLFGPDFIYPPYVAFKEAYKKQISVFNKRSEYDSIKYM